jgi:hypothetical protein
VARTNAMTVSFKVALLAGEMDFSSDTAQTFNIALYTDLASLDVTTTAYSTTNEVADGGGYTAGGIALTISQVPVGDGAVAYVSFSDPAWNTSTITARGALIYETGAGTPSVAVLDFGSNKTTSGGNFVVNMPTDDASTAILRLG